MAKSFQVNIITPAKVAFEQDAVSIILPGSQGYLGAWANHAPLVTGVRPGVVWLKLDDAGTERHFAVTGGFCEISANQVNLMVDAADEASEIDLAAAREDLARVREELKAHEDDAAAEALRAEADLAEARIKAAETQRKR